MRGLNRFLFSSLLLSSFAAVATVPDEIPDVLKPWEAWVLHGQETRLCPELSATMHLCAWPSPLELELGRNGGHFRQNWRLYAPAWLPLPGDENWPQNVSVNGSGVPVVEHDSHPSIYLESAGDYRIEGDFLWNRQPERLTIPDASALLSVSLDGKPLARPERAEGALWLGRRQDDKKEAEALDVQVFRKLTDGQPQTLDTEIELNVSGPGREILLDRIMLPDFAPMSVAGELPARIEADGRLRVQVRPGTYTIKVAARAEHPLKAIGLPKVGDVADEVWSFANDEQLRISSLEGGTTVDPGEAGVPDDWQRLPAYRVEPGQTLTVVERSRGLAAQDANQLHLNRSMWLAFDGSHYVLKDVIQGRMHQGWRMDMKAPYVLRRAEASGDELLVTQGGDGLTGVELREPSVNLETVADIGRGEASTATGWNEVIDGVNTTLHLPPGYRLIAASGADSVPNAWLSQWNLLNFFLVLVIAVAIGKLLGWPWGGMALVLLGLSLHEPGSPQWSWLNLVIAAALARYLPPNRFQRVIAGYRTASLVLVILVALPFITSQLRLSLYPQLEASLGRAESTAYTLSASVAVNAPPAPVMADGAVSEEKAGALRSATVAKPGLKRTDVERIEVTGSRIRSVDLLSRYDPDARIQAGPGLPSWSWNTYYLQWNGPVAPDQALRLHLVTPFWLVVLRLLVVALTGALLAVFARQSFPSPRWPSWLSGHAPTTAALGLALALLVPTPRSEAALPPKPETPSANILAELKRRLLEPPKCRPGCVALPAGRVELEGETLLLQLDISALADVALAIPGAEAGWMPERVRLDELSVPVLRQDGKLYVAVSPGLHRLQLSGSMPGLDSVPLAFPVVPRWLSARLDGWEMSGLVDGRVQGDHLEFNRIKTGEASSQNWAEMTRIPSFVQVRRELLFDRDWIVRTHVDRVAPEHGPISLSIPLLPGESVHTQDIKVRDGKVLVSLAADEAQFTWESFLARSPNLKLEAADSPNYVERWSYAASPSLHVEHAGVPVLAGDPNSNDYHPEFAPLPGEALTLTVSRPAASQGDTLAIDEVQLNATVGQRAQETTLNLSYRSSRGGQHGLMLPPDAEVSAVLADGKRLGLRPDQGKLLLPLQPGAHGLSIRWRQNREIGTRQGFPAVDFGHPASNLSLSLNVPGDRWILWTSGPTIGPAVLYWGELAVFILVALALGRTRQTPLKTRHWLLLGLGLSTLAWATLAVVVLWLFVLAWRGRLVPPKSASNFNLMQVGLGILTFVALAALVGAIPQALLSLPDMHIVGNASYGGQLNWFSDETAGAMPMVTVISLPIWVYKLAMLAWALWLSLALIAWLRWGWSCFTAGGLWLSPPPAPAAPAVAETPADSATESPKES